MLVTPAVLNFENVLPSTIAVTGTLTAVEGPSGTGDPLNLNAVQTNQFVTITNNFTQNGGLVWMLAGKNWHFDVFLEPMGAGAPIAVTPTDQLASGSIGAYSISVTIPAGTVVAGIYRVTARFMLTPAPGLTISPCVSFADLGIAQWYDF